MGFKRYERYMIGRPGHVLFFDDKAVVATPNPWLLTLCHHDWSSFKLLDLEPWEQGTLNVSLGSNKSDTFATYHPLHRRRLSLLLWLPGHVASTRRANEAVENILALSFHMLFSLLDKKAAVALMNSCKTYCFLGGFFRQCLLLLGTCCCFLEPGQSCGMGARSCWGFENSGASVFSRGGRDVEFNWILNMFSVA